MIFFDLLFVLFFTLLLTFILAGPLGWRHPYASGAWDGFLFLFVILFLATWAGGTWLTPLGPVLWGVAWAPFLAVGVVVALILLAAMGPRPPRERPQPGDANPVGEETAAILFNGFFWMLVMLTILVISLRYIL